MNIKILDSWLREFVTTKASAKKIAEVLSLTSVSVEKLEKVDNDFIYEIEVTTNRPDLMSVIGLARETAAVLPQFDMNAAFEELKLTLDKQDTLKKFPIEVKDNPALVNRICAVIMEVDVKPSHDIIKKRLEASGIRSLNNLVDVTNYIMREIGHPAHVFDYDRLNTKKMIIRESKTGEKVVTLDKKEYVLLGGDIVADNGKGEIVDLLGVMGTENSVVTDKTKRIMLFIDNNNPTYVRKTSMSLGIRSEAAVLNEKGIDPELALPALLRGIQMYQKIANGRIISPILDIYPNKVKTKTVVITPQNINETIGINIPTKTSVQILKSLGFMVTIHNENIHVLVPSWRLIDVSIEEDVIEEIARVYGYHRLPIALPPLTKVDYFHMGKNLFYWEKRIKDSLKYFGFTEVYTYSMVSEELLEGPTDEAVELANPLGSDMAYLRRTVVPSLLKTVRENKNRETLQIFELTNIYEKTKEQSLPNEIPMLAGVVKKEGVSFYEVKGIIEQLFNDLAIKHTLFKKKQDGEGADVFINKEKIGVVEVLEENLIDFELCFAKILNYVSLKKIYKPIPKYPPVIEDLRIVTTAKISYAEIIDVIKKQSSLVVNVSLLDVFENKKTFRIIYQNPEKNLADEEVAKERKKIIGALGIKLHATVG